MKRKKWSELEEQSLLTKYSDLLNSGTLPKLKTREKKFKPIADHVNSVHHLQDPINFPFKWSWRDVSIKVQNMRHQYLGVKQKIRVSDSEFNWNDGENHWENFLMYKQVFGDFELEKVKSNNFYDVGLDLFGDSHNAEDVLGLGFEEDGELGGDDDVAVSEDGVLVVEMDRVDVEEIEDVDFVKMKKLKKGFALVGAQVLELRDVVVRREEKRREREWRREEGVSEREEMRLERDFLKEKRLREREEDVEIKELQLEERQLAWAKKEFDSRLRLEREFDEEKKRRMKLEEKWEEEEMRWKERMMTMQIEHEKQMMQMQADACQNQMQILGAMARLVCQFFGTSNDGLGGGLGSLTPQVLQNLQQHPGGLVDNGKPDDTRSFTQHSLLLKLIPRMPSSSIVLREVTRTHWRLCPCSSY